jgi:hypothetical protein
LANYYDAIDLKWTRAGDYVEENGDLADTSEDGLLSLIQELADIAKCELGDWELYSGRGFGPEDFVGRTNNAHLAKLMHDRLRVSYVSQGVVNDEDLSIRVIPVLKTEVLILVRIDALPTPYNSLGQGESLVVQMLFNYAEKGIFVLSAGLNLREN